MVHMYKCMQSMSVRSTFVLTKCLVAISLAWPDPIIRFRLAEAGKGSVYVRLSCHGILLL